VTGQVRPYGTWPSPLTPQALVAGAATVGEARVDGDDVWWSEARPAEGGRVELVRRRVDGTAQAVLGRLDAAREPSDGEALTLDRRWSARTAFLEYGGGAWCVESGVVTFAHWDDQRLHRLVADDTAALPTPLTPAPRSPRGLRYAEVVAWDHAWVLAVREAHPGEEGVPGDAREPVHEIVAVPTDGSAATEPGRVRVLVSGPDFLSGPRPGPGRLAWVQWDHPRMPWDGTELCVARLGRDADGGPVVRDAVTVAGGAEESVVQPEWDAAGDLWFSSDRSGWWNLHRVGDPGGDGPDARPRAVAPVEAELGGPRWVAGLRWYAPLADGRLLATVTAGGSTTLALVEPPALGEGGAGRVVPLAVDLGGAPVTVAGQVGAGPGPAQAVAVLASARCEPTPVLLDLGSAASAPGSDAGRGRRAVPGSARWSGGASIAAEGAGAPAPGAPAALTVPGGSGPGPSVDPSGGAGTPGRASGDRPRPVRWLALRAARHLGLAPDDVSVPEPVSFPSAGGRTAHALLYRPARATVTGPAGERPPLVVMIHGGPTSAARPMFDLRTQFWTTRGVAVVDVDYGGSTGYGRPYRRLLDGQWGVVDVEDCVAAARHLAAEGVVDGDRMVIRGGSAGGFTALLALCTSDTFAAGTSLYGVTDLAALARDTHKFEARYTDGLVGPWPEAADLYAARSPLTQLDRLATPVLVLQGAEDHVVPPAQAEAVVAALAAKGVPHAYLLFPGEGHGFRGQETIVRALQAELAFYGRVLGFAPADELPPLPPTV